MAEYRIDITGDTSGIKAEKAVAVHAVREIGAERDKEVVKNRDRNGRFIKAGQEATDAQKKGFQDVLGATNLLNGALGSLTAQFGVMQVATGYLRTAFKNFEDIRDAAREAATYVTDMRDKSRELAAMKGDLGNTGKEVLSNFKVRAQTLQTADEVRAFQSKMVGVGASALSSDLIDQKEFDKLGIMGGKFQTAEGGDAGTHGQLAGMIPSLMGRKVDAKEAYGKIQQLYNVMAPGGSEFTPGMNQLMKNAPYITPGVYNDVADMAAVQSAFSVNNPEGAGQNVQQFTRATVGGLGKLKGVPIEGDSQKVGQYLTGIGATNQMDAIGIGKLISGDMGVREAEAQAKGEKFNAMDYLKHQGYGNMEDTMALMNFHRMNKSGQLKTFTDLAAPDKAMGGGEAEGKIAKFFATDPLAGKRIGDVSESLKKYEIGSGPMEYLANLRKGAFEANSVGNDPRFYGKMEDWQNDYFTGGRNALTNKMLGALRPEAERVGVAMPKTWNEESPFFDDDDKRQAGAFYGLATKIREKGGNIQPQLGDLLKAAERQAVAAERLAQAYERSQPAAPPPLNGPPRGLPARP